MKCLSVIWLIFGVLFLCLCFYHVKAATNAIAPFKLTELKKIKLADEFITPLTGVDIEKPLRNFVADFNSYIDEYNRSACQQNILTAVGYFLASLTAFFSMYLCKKETTKN